MDKTYNPKTIEDKWYAAWVDAGLFHGDAARGGEPYAVVIPPPNVTGILHMGHALNNTIQDILVRWRRMQGRNVVWMPGTDHAGIATQNVVERALRAEGVSREDLGREAFIQRVRAWREEYGGTIIRQLKKLGCSCDWERERFTMDAGLSDAVAEVFVRLYNKGLIYRANYIINWCPRCHTALSDEESEHQDTTGKLYYIRYPVKANGGETCGQPSSLAPRPSPLAHIVVATTRPETLLGDVAVAVHPDDPRYAGLEEQTVLLPVLNRELRVIRDTFVDPKFGTGVVKVTPAHDPNDFEMGQRHSLDPVNVMNGDGTMNAEAGPYAGMDRFACRKKILADLEADGLIEKVEDHAHAVGHCYRCDTVVEPRLSPQWFVRMKPLAEPALEAVTSGRITFVPGRWTKVYQEWMENIRDWCISRQIWWGHRIPVFTCACGHEWAAKGRPEACPACGGGEITQDEDVLDTWFSSWLWPFSTFGWPEDNPDLRFYYPTHDLVTASEIIFFWVARMIMAGIEFMGDIPFSRVTIHGTVRDDTGRKMSKSLGNSIDPLTIIEATSADALRFSLMMITATGQDVFLSNDKFEIGRNFGTKLWNAARFMRMQENPPRPSGTFPEEGSAEHAPGAHPEEGSASGSAERTQQAAAESPPPEGCPDASRGGVGSGVTDFNSALVSADDAHILMRLRETVLAVNDGLEKQRFNDAAHALYEFVWHQFCDWYVEYAKTAFYGDDPARKAHVLGVMRYVLSRALRLLHPMMPFLTEELWHAMGFGGEGEYIMTAPWPEPDAPEALTAWNVTDARARYVEDRHELIRLGRTLRSDYQIPPGKPVDFIIKPANAADAAQLLAEETLLRTMLKAGTIAVDAAHEAGKAMPSAMGHTGTISLSLAGVIDVEAEAERLTKQLTGTLAQLERITHKLDNAQFVSKAPPDVVAREEQRKDALVESAEKLRRLIATLSEV
jgi:valyl-tRNA synthetase